MTKKILLLSSLFFINTIIFGMQQKNVTLFAINNSSQSFTINYQVKNSNESLIIKPKQFIDIYLTGPSKLIIKNDDINIYSTTISGNQKDIFLIINEDLKHKPVSLFKIDELTNLPIPQKNTFVINTRDENIRVSYNDKVEKEIKNVTVSPNELIAFPILENTIFTIESDNKILEMIGKKSNISVIIINPKQYADTITEIEDVATS